MKTKIKRHSRSVISVLLAVCMLVSCMTVGLIATDAAKTDSEALGAATYYLYYRKDNKKDLSGMTAVQMTASGSNYVASFTMPTGNNFDLGIGTSSTPSSTMVTSSWTVNKDSGINFANIEDNNGTRYIVGSVKTSGTVTVTYTPSSTISLTTAGGGSDGSNQYCLTGDSAITGTSSWTNNTTTNKLTYNSTSQIYTITKTVSFTSGTFNFRITDFGSWTSTYNFEKANLVNTAGIVTTWQAQPNSTDKNIQMQLSQAATIEIRLDDSKTDTSALTVIVTPTTSTVTAAVNPANSGTATVNGVASATATYGGTVSLSATAANYYVFKNWSTTNNKVSIAGSSSASTTASVYGTDTVTANFDKTRYTVSRGTGGTTDANMFTITTPSANQSKQWDTTVNVAASVSSDLYCIDYLYYLNNNTGEEQKLGTVTGSTSSPAAAAAGAGTESSMTGTFTMPKNNVTVYAHTHKKPSYAVYYAVSTDSGSAGHGYVNAGMQYTTSTTNVTKTITSGDSVLQNDKVNIGARAEEGYRFVGWYPNADGSGDVISTNKDVTVTVDAAKNYYAKFESLSAGDNKIKVYLPKSFADHKLWYWGAGLNAENDGIGTHGSDTTKVSAICTLVDLNGTEYYVKEFTPTTNPSTANFTFRIINSSVNNDNTITGYGAYTFSAVNANTKAVPTFDIFYPVKFVVTNPELAAAETYAPLFGKKSTSTTFYHKPSDTDNNKMSVTTTGFTANDPYKTTEISSSKEMPTSGATTPVFTVTFIPKDYYKVTFSAGAGGTVSATAGGADITSGTKVKEGTTVTITAAASDGYEFKGWTGAGSGSGTTRTISDISADSEVKAYFTVSKGTPNTGTYFGWARANTDTNVYPGDWSNFSTTYVRDGHVWAYIDNVTAGFYYISAYGSEVTSSSTAQDKCQKQYYRSAKNESGDAWVSTEFSTYVTNCGRSEWGTNDKPCWEGRCNYGHFQVTSDVKALIIDLGPDDGSGHAQTSSGDENHKFVQNNYRIIPVFNTDINKVSVYAKDSSFRDNAKYDYLPSIANTVITEDTNVTGRVEHSEFETAVATKGQSITVTTTIDDNHKGRYFVRGFSVNGVTPRLYEYRSDGVYSMTYNIPAGFDSDYLEITPIYAEYGVTNVKFYIENYDEAFQKTGWGNTLSIYPYYQDPNTGDYVSDKHNAFGGYPGQPVINNGGRRFIEIPVTYRTLVSDGSQEDCEIKGITLSNDYFDIVHRDYCREVDDHLQTYDYDDFYKIYKETSDHKEVNQTNPTDSSNPRYNTADQITFAIKHRTETNNFSDNTTTQTYSNTGNSNVPAPYSSFAVSEKNSKFGNGWEPLLDYHDRPVDLFGKQLTTAEQAKEPLLVVSDDYSISYVGRYATSWTVYKKNSAGTDYEKIAEIAPSALIVTSADRLAAGSPYPIVTDQAGYPVTTGHTLPDYTDEYTELKKYANTPVEITYEQAIRNQYGYEKYWDMNNDNKSQVSKRSDGRWFYSYMNEEINANLRIDYTDEYTGEETTVWTSDTYKTNSNTGTKTGATVHFTNDNTTADDGGYVLTDYHDTADWTAADPDHHIIYSNFNHYYKFAATEGAGYIFQGWYMERDGIQTAVTPDNVKQFTGKSQMTSNATFVARYVKNPAGHLTINHTIAEGSTGTGTTYISVEKCLNGTWSNVSNGFERVDAFSINNTDIMSYGSGCTLRVTLKTDVVADTAFDRFSAADGANDHSSEFFSTDVTPSGSSYTTSFEIPVDDLFELNQNTGIPKQKDNYDTFTYYSHIAKKPELTINHNIDPTSDGTAEGTTYVKVEILTAGNVVSATYGGTEAEGYALGTENIVIPSTYFNATDSYKIKVYLKTVMTGFTQFDKFSIIGETIANEQGSAGQQRSVSNSADYRTYYATETFTLSSLFSGGAPTKTLLPYLSRLVVPDYKYEITYTYPSYLKNNDGTYTNQSYTAKESFAPEDLTEYMILDNGDLAFQNDAKKLSFICMKAPYEDNFQKKIDFSKHSTINARSYSSYVLALDVSVTAEQELLSVYFDFPYQTTQSNEFVPVVADGKVVKTDSNIKGKNDIYGRDWFVTNDVRNSTVSGTPEYVKAPLIIYNDNGTPADTTDDCNEYFKYWSVKTEATATDPAREFTRCYDYEFNLAIFQNCVITPEYDTTSFAARGMVNPPTAYNGYNRYDADVNRRRYSAGENGVSITFLENSRNQWNNDGGGSNPSSRHAAGDRIYSDFLLTFDNDPMVTLKDSTANTKQAGLIIQPVAILESDGKDGYTVKSDSYYSSAEAAETYGGATPAQIKTHLEGGAQVARIQRSKFDVTSLDNKNRIQFYYGIDNAQAKATGANADADDIIRVGNTYNNQKVVFKAFAYIGDGTADSDTLSNVVVSSRPIYFTIYQAATIAPGYYMPSTSGSGS